MSHSRQWNILVVTSDLGGRGGIQRHSRTLIEVLRGHLGLAVETCDLRLDGTWIRRVAGLSRGLFHLFHSRPDLVLCTHVGLAPIGLFATRILNTPYVVIVYGVEIWGIESCKKHRLLSNAAGTWAVSTFTAAKVGELYPSASRPVMIGTGIRNSFFEPLTDAGTCPPTLLTVTRLDDLKYKGIDVVLDALKLLRKTGTEVHYVIVGDGPARAALATMVDDKDLSDCVEVLGAVSEAELLTQYRRAHVFVLVSRYAEGPNPMGEGLGLATLEAAAAGVPVVVGQQGGSVDTVEDGVTGLLVPPGDPSAIARAVQALLYVDTAAAAERPEIISTWTKRRFGLAAFAERLRVALHEVGVSV